MSTSARRLTPDDWALLREIRLAALVDSPDAFLEALDDARARPEQIWRFMAPTRAVAFTDDTPIGMVGWREDHDLCQLVGLWVQPEYRGTAAASDLVDIVLTEAQSPVWLEVKRTNARAIAFYRKAGFVDSPTPPTASDHLRLDHPRN